MDRLGSVFGERELVWLEDVSHFDYVKQGLWPVWGRSARPDFRYGRLVGYAKLEPGAPETVEGSGRYNRRLFWIGGDDEIGFKVDPRSVAAGLPGLPVVPKT